LQKKISDAKSEIETKQKKLDQMRRMSQETPKEKKSDEAVLIETEESGETFEAKLAAEIDRLQDTLLKLLSDQELMNADREKRLEKESELRKNIEQFDDIQAGDQIVLGLISLAEKEDLDHLNAKKQEVQSLLDAHEEYIKKQIETDFEKLSQDQEKKLSKKAEKARKQKVQKSKKKLRKQLIRARLFKIETEVSESEEVLKSAENSRRRVIQKRGKFYQIVQNSFNVADKIAHESVVLSSKGSGGLNFAGDTTILLSNEVNQTISEGVQNGRESGNVLGVDVKVRASKDGADIDLVVNSEDKDVKDELIQKIAGKLAMGMTGSAIIERGAVRVHIKDEAGNLYEHMIADPVLAASFREGTRFKVSVRAGKKDENSRSLSLQTVSSTLNSLTNSSLAAAAFQVPHEVFLAAIRSMDGKYQSANNRTRILREQLKTETDSVRRTAINREIRELEDTMTRPDQLGKMAEQLGMSWDQFIRALREKMALIERVRVKVIQGKFPEESEFSQSEFEELLPIVEAFKTFLGSDKKDIQERILALTEELEDIEAEIVSLNVDLKLSGADEAIRIQKKIQDLEKKTIKVADAITAAEKEQESKKAKIQAADRRINSLKSQVQKVTEHEEKYSTAKGIRDRTTNSLTKKKQQSIMDEAEQDLNGRTSSELQSQILQLESEREKLVSDQEVEQIEGDLDPGEKLREIDESEKSREKEYENRKQLIEPKLEKASDQLEQAESALEEIEKELESVRIQLQDAAKNEKKSDQDQQNEKKLQDAFDAIQSRRQSAVKQVDESKERKNKIQDELDELEAEHEEDQNESESLRARVLQQEVRRRMFRALAGGDPQGASDRRDALRDNGYDLKRAGDDTESAISEEVPAYAVLEFLNEKSDEMRVENPVGTESSSYYLAKAEPKSGSSPSAPSPEDLRSYNSYYLFALQNNDLDDEEKSRILIKLSQNLEQLILGRRKPLQGDDYRSLSVRWLEAQEDIRLLSEALSQLEELTGFRGTQDTILKSGIADRFIFNQLDLMAEEAKQKQNSVAEHRLRSEASKYGSYADESLIQTLDKQASEQINGLAASPDSPGFIGVLEHAENMLLTGRKSPDTDLLERARKDPAIAQGNPRAARD
ncbi:MAG: hypothetical protein KC649_03000, partial [Candidatus Omnitrophica bacterium]|nr:hypothetical protein [Candidatus Omnitrophota bacterium]